MIESYQPTLHAYFSTVTLPFLVAIALAIGLFFLQKKEVAYRNRTYKSLFVLLGLFGIVLLLGIAGFSWFNFNRMQPIELHTNQLKIEGKYLDFKDIKRVFIHRDFQSSHVSPQIVKDTTLILVVQERNGKSHAFAEENYPIKEMVVAINKQMEK